MKRKDIKKKIKEYFFLYPTAKQRVRHLERALHVPLPSVIKYVKELEKESLLKSTSIAKVIIYSADRTSKKYLFEKKLFNMRQIFYSGLLEYLDAELSNPTVIVFGSYSKGEDREESDIDIYVESPAKKKVDLKKFEEILQRRIQVFLYKNIHEVENKELANNVINGTIMNGYLEVFK